MITLSYIVIFFIGVLLGAVVVGFVIAAGRNDDE